MATSATAGVFTCANLVKVTVQMEKVWASAQALQMNDFEPMVDSLKIVMQKQTAQLAELQQADKDKEIRLYWVTDCNNSIQDCSDDCVVGGDELEARCKDYALDICKTDGFNVKEKAFRAFTVSREEVVAKGLLKRMKNLDEYLAQALISKLNIFAGVNQFAGIGYVGNSGTTHISPSYWTADLMGYFAQVAKMNKLGNVFMLHGNNLWNTQWSAQFQGAGSDSNNAAKMNSLQQYWDPFNVDSVNVGQKVSYMISSGAVAVVTKNYNSTTPVDYIGAGQTRYAVASKSLPGVMYDVVYTNECVGNEITHKWSLYLKAGIFQNPFGCNEDVTGVLKFVCGAADSQS